ncbi:hypothetical protein BABINDRAFT_7299 [Babjeviella inositovora NRRL Y-12698]|uniref:DUF202 domain-containing protein n=1 Tax=Babjeviella inositovora NRRL Y-12698 TaxID=984486 RepID=A0A1E3QSA3_9ASCO|nr:uncharacterized protein BABINDRAFT_7299 [Babjeviella inositovora NRRL Y-12698]ODQ80583.1 hypothetical protein BABINDRAFT_7299 [Babjeviella inositovora NRRL Y-12698]
MSSPITDERTSLLYRLNPSLIMENTTSQPRDGLQAERTTLTFTRFSATLAFTSVAMVLNYRLESSSLPEDDGFHRSKFTLPVGILLITLALSSLVVSGFNYVKTIRHYASGKIKTVSSLPTILLVSCIVVVLLGINIGLIIDGYSS